MNSVKKGLLKTFVILLLLTGCSAESTAPNYDEIKKMMTDSLQTEDGKKTLRQILAEDDFRELVALEQPVVKKSIEETLLSKQGEDFWKKAFEDPKFTESVAKSMKEQQEDVMKKLMEDASFLKAMEDFFGQPDMQKQMETILKSATMKEQYEKAIEETINSPLLQTKWEKLIKEAGKAPEEKGKKGKEEEAQTGGQGDGGGGGK